MKDFSQVLRIIFERFDEANMVSILIFHIGICFIALIIDKLLLGTFPAFTLIGIVLLITNVSIKAYNSYLIRKNSKYFQKKF